MILSILPLAITMVAGPQILASIIFVTSKDSPVRVSLSYLTGVFLAASLGVSAFFVAARLLGLHAAADGSPSALSQRVQYVVIALLIALSLRAYRDRKTSKPPKWLVGLESVKPPAAFKLGILLILLMPGDIFMMSVVGIHIAGHGVHASDVANALPFLFATLLLAALPLIGYLLLGKRAVVLMPKLRNWMQTNSWLVNIIVYIFFILLITHVI